MSKTIKVKGYPDITGITLATNTHIESVNYAFDITQIDYCIEGMSRTKAEVLDEAKHIQCTGYGKHSGHKVWQLPAMIQAQIRKQMQRVEVEFKHTEHGYLSIGVIVI